MTALIGVFTAPHLFAGPDMGSWGTREGEHGKLEARLAPRMMLADILHLLNTVLGGRLVYCKAMADQVMD